VCAARRFDLVASDLDGTLLRTDDGLSARSKTAIHGAIATGAIFVYATGRPPRWVDPVVVDLGHRGFAVASNGAYVLDLSIDHEHDRVVERVEIGPDAARDAVTLIRSVVADIAFACDGLGGFAHESGYQTKFELPPYIRVAPVEELLDRPYAKLLFRHPEMGPDMYAAIVEAVGEIGVVTFGATPAHGTGRTLPDAGTLIEVQAFGVSKAAGLRRVCERIGHASHGGVGAMAFGDMPNDIEMLRWAEHGVAMANAHDDVIASADEVTASNDDDGVALVIEREFELSAH
jgi:hydroxymethylpyrimidine pyrophosphatase-like HAD family hydrolase